MHPRRVPSHCTEAQETCRALESLCKLGRNTTLPSAMNFMQQCNDQHILLIAQGSGKTLAFGLPILQLLHSEMPTAHADANSEEEGAAAGGSQPKLGAERIPLRALILEPTRELAMQVGLPFPAGL